MAVRIRVTSATSEPRDLAVSASDLELRLSDFLEQSHLPLNTRCGQTGLCRGCMVRVAYKGQSRECRACQVKVAELPASVLVDVPKNSLRTLEIHGVTDFEVLGNRFRPSFREGYGLAFDIGTTTVAVALWDLAKGTCLGTRSTANAQRRFGDNVLSRIEYASSSSGSVDELQRVLVRDSLLPVVDQLCCEAGIGLTEVTDAVVTGNTVMLHAILGLSLEGFRRFPFRHVFQKPKRFRSSEIGFPGDFDCLAPACPGPFVGADVAAGALAAGLLEADQVALLIDFGTNGEILLKQGASYIATATAAGPAFEGGNLTCGKPAASDAVSRVTWVGDRFHLVGCNGNVLTNPEGITGAAYIDFLALGLANGWINRVGRFDRDHPWVTKVQIEGEDEYAVELAPETFITETDIAELLQAKAAIAGGVVTLLDGAGLSWDRLDVLSVAGGFGFHLDIRNAIAIGLIPDIDPKRIQVIGNASLGGASQMVLEGRLRAEELLLSNCRVVELNTCDSFEDHFIDCLCIEPLGPD